MALTCEQCGKRLSRKTARCIDGRVMCSTCMFAPSRDDYSGANVFFELGVRIEEKP